MGEADEGDVGDRREPPPGGRPGRVYAPIFHRLGWVPPEVPPPGTGSGSGTGPETRRPGEDRSAARPDRRSSNGRPRRSRSGRGRAEPTARPMPRAATAGPSWTSVPIEQFAQMVVERLIKIRQPGWRPDQVPQAVAAVDDTLTRELDARAEGGGAFGRFENIADHLDYLRTTGHPEVGRAVAAAARRAGLRDGPARLSARIAAALPRLRYDTQLWACALVLRIVDACVRAELRSRRPDASGSTEGVTVAQVVARLPGVHPPILHPAP